LSGTALTIRKLRPAYFTLEELVTVGTLSRSVADELTAAVDRRDNQQDHVAQCPDRMHR
jgi:Flp pilus assembly CpaF family ATPase